MYAPTFLDSDLPQAMNDSFICCYYLARLPNDYLDTKRALTPLACDIEKLEQAWKWDYNNLM